VNPDECAAAADFYQCGKEKAPSVSNAIQAGMKDSVKSLSVRISYLIRVNKK